MVSSMTSQIGSHRLSIQLSIVSANNVGWYDKAVQEIARIP